MRKFNKYLTFAMLFSGSMQAMTLKPIVSALAVLPVMDLINTISPLPMRFPPLPAKKALKAVLRIINLLFLTYPKL